MGYSFMPQYGKKNKEEIVKFFLSELNCYDQEVIHISIIGAQVYLAIKNKETSKIYGLVVLIRNTSTEFGWKYISEDMGPYYFNAPKKLINKLTPTENEYSKQWRNNCLTRKKLKI